MVTAPPVHAQRVGPCAICGGPCKAFPDIDHRARYPFLPGGREVPDGQHGIDWVYADRRIDDPELERAVYGVGDRVPMADAIRYGLVAEPAQPEPPKRPKGKRGPAEDRARRPGEDR